MAAPTRRDHTVAEKNPLIRAALLSVVCLYAAVAYPQATSTWTGGAGNWEPCPQQQGTALWDTCPIYPQGDFNAVIPPGDGPVSAVSNTIVNLSVGSQAVLNIFNTSILDITGSSIANNGSIVLTSSNGLFIQPAAIATLSGTGTVFMNNSNTRFGGGGVGAGLINQETIQGQGSLGVESLAITNQGTISSSGGTLTIQPSTGGITNTGLIQSLSGSQLVLVGGPPPPPFNNSGGRITAQNNSSISLEMNISGGTLTTAGSGNFTAGSNASITSLTNAGTFNVPSGQNLNWVGTINNTGVFNLNGSIFPQGVVTLKGSGKILMTSGTLNGLGANSLVNQSLIHGSGTIFSMTALTNQATIQADNSSGTLTINDSPITNTSILEATGGGTLDIESVVNNTGGTIEAQNGSTVIIGSHGIVGGGTLTTSGTGAIQSQNGTLDGTTNIPTNAGLLDVNGLDLFFQGTINNTGTISLSGNGCVILNHRSTLTGTGVLKMASTTCMFGSGMRFTNKSNILGAGTIGDSNPMPITNNGTIQANSTTNPLFINSGTYGFTNNGKLIVNASSTLNVQGLFNNLHTNGTLTGGSYLVIGTLGVQNSVVTNAANITLSGAAAKISNTNMGTNALATLTSNATTGILSLQSGQVLMTAGNLSNAGMITVGTATSFKVGGSYTQTAGKTTVDGTLTAPTGLLLQNGMLQGQGTVAAAMTSDATVVAGDTTSKAGKLAINGSYTESGTGALDVAIGGHTVGTQYSQLTVSNGAHLSGTLNIKLINGFVPSIGSVFTILTANPVTHTFATVNGLHINSGEHFDIAYTSTAVTLTVAAGP